MVKTKIQTSSKEAAGAKEPAAKKPDLAVKAETTPAEPRRDVFRQFEHAMLDMERRMDLLLRDVFDQGGDESIWPRNLFHGLSMQKGPNGHLRFQPFGNLGQTLEALREGWREPFLTWDIDEGEGRLRLRAETPGIQRDDIDLEVTDDCIYLKAESDDHKYQAQCTPGVELDPKNAEAHYANGILQVDVPLRGDARPKGAKVKVQ